MSIICTICLAELIVKSDRIFTTSCGHLFHEKCLNISLRTSAACPQCRKRGIQSHQVYFEVDDNYEEAGTSNNSAQQCSMESLNKKMNEMTKTLDQINMNTTAFGQSSGSTLAQRIDMKKWKDECDKFRIENKNLKEIIEMERILAKNADFEIKKLNEDVRERNDIINALQLDVDSAREEVGNFNLATQRSMGAGASTSSYRSHKLLDI
ncbi:unnamed protein product [Diamesa serratosioi]